METVDEVQDHQQFGSATSARRVELGAESITYSQIYSSIAPERDAVRHRRND